MMQVPTKHTFHSRERKRHPAVTSANGEHDLPADTDRPTPNSILPRKTDARNLAQWQFFDPHEKIPAHRYCKPKKANEQIPRYNTSTDGMSIGHKEFRGETQVRRMKTSPHHHIQKTDAETGTEEGRSKKHVRKRTTSIENIDGAHSWTKDIATHLK